MPYEKHCLTASGSAYANKRECLAVQEFAFELPKIEPSSWSVLEVG